MGPITPGLQTFISDRDRLIALACRITNNPAIAEELVQESWIRWHGKSYAEKDARPIFRQIVANLARDWHRRRKTETAYLLVQSGLVYSDVDSERIVIAQQELRCIGNALKGLPPRVVSAFHMSRVEGLSYAEIAKRLDTVPSRIHGYIVKALVQISLALADED